MMNGYQKPPSHRWDSLEDVPLTQCFHDSTSQAELTQSSDESSGHSHSTTSSDLSELLTEKPEVVEEGKEFKSIINPSDNSVSRRAPKAVDDDLYKIPPELLFSKPKKKMGMGLFAMICVLPRCAF